MKKITILSAVLLLGGIVAIAGLSSFRQNEQKKESFSETYFKFSELVPATDQNLKDPANWQVVTVVPTENPCDEGYDAPCIIRVSNSAAGINPLSMDQDKIDQLVEYLDYLDINYSILPTDFVSEEGTYVFQRTDHH